MKERPTLRVGGVRWRLRRGDDPARVRPLLEQALAALRAGGTVDVKSGRRKSLYPLRLASDGRVSHLLKVNRYSAYHGWRRRLLAIGSKSRHELEMAESVAARGVPTPVPLAAGERRVAGRLESCLLLAPLVPDAVDLRALWLDARRSAAERRAAARAFGALSRRIHEAGIFQDDFAPNNFLVSPGDPPYVQMIDFERARLRRGNDTAARRFMLAKAEREVGAAASTADRWRFLLAYADGDRTVARRWWRQVEAWAPRLARRDVERMLVTASSDGRRFRRLESAGWSGWVHGAAPDPGVFAALEREPVLAHPAPEPEVRALADTWCAIAARRDEEDEALVWAAAQILHERGLAPVPRAWLRRGAAAVLVWERGEAWAWCDDADRARAERAARVLLRRLLALGDWGGGVAPGALALAAQRTEAPRALLLAPHALRLAGRADAGGGTHLDALCDALAGTLTDPRAAAASRA